MNSTLPNLIARRDLLRELVTSDVQSSTAETKLGWLWWFLDPLLHMLIYWGIVVVIIGRGKPQYAPYPMFLLCALLTWKHFSASAGGATKVLRAKETLIKSVPFPTMVLPLSQMLTAFAFFSFGMVVLFVASLIFPSLIFVEQGGNHVALIQVVPLLVLQIMIVTGISLPLACFGVLLRDLSGLMTHLLRIGFYCSPGLFSCKMVEEVMTEKLGAKVAGTNWESLPQILFTVYMLNPFALLINGYRRAILWGEWVPASAWITLFIEAVVLLYFGYRIFQHYDRRVIKFL